MDITEYTEDIAIARKALIESKLSCLTNGRELLCEVYSIPSQLYQSFYIQIYDGDTYTLLYAKPYVSDYLGLHDVKSSFADAVKAARHPGRKGDIYCGIRHLPKNDQHLSKLIECLPCKNEEAVLDAVVLDGLFMLIRNCQTDPHCVLTYRNVGAITKNRYTEEQKQFLQDLHLYMEQIIGNLLKDR